jgi:AcrR family transcriptional regulator
MPHRKEKIASSEEKIKDAARKVFIRKGFSATRTRDIAKEADINPALLNYYFRSKQKLFELVMYEKIQNLFGSIFPILDNKAISLEKKVELMVANYIEVLCESPDLPIFVFNELQKNNFDIVPDPLIAKKLNQSSFFKQLKAKRDDVDPIHFLMTLLGMTIFPFVTRPQSIVVGFFNDKTFRNLMQERKKLIPIWMKAILKSK